MYRRLLGLVALILASAFATPTLAQKGEEKKEPPAPAVTLPPEAINIVYESFAKALEMVPNAVVLSPARFRALLEELERYKKLAERPPALTPSSLTLEGKVDGNLVHLTAVYKIATTSPDEVVRLGGSPAQAIGVSLNGKTPRLTAGRSDLKGRDEGFFVQIDKPGNDHELTLVLVLPLGTRTSGQGFSLELPRAASTQLQFDLPAGSRDIRLGGKPLGKRSPFLEGNRLSTPLGSIDKLDLDWATIQTAAAAPVLSADGLVQVRLDNQKITTTARLTLRAQSGQPKQWRIVVPAGADLTFPEADKARVKRVESPDKKQPGLRTIHLEEASTEPLTVLISTSAVAPRPGSGKSAIGPFNVLGAAEQRGSLLVSSSVADWHVEPTPRGDLTRRAVTEDEVRNDPSLTAAFRYGPGSTRQTGLPWLDIEVELVGGQIKARPAYTLTLVRKEGNVLHWKVHTTLTVTPRRAAIDRFAVTLPPNSTFDEASLVLPERVRGYHLESSKRILEFRLNPTEAEVVAPVTVQFEVALAPLLPDTTETIVALPRPQGMLEQDGTIRVVSPTGIELLAPPAERMVGLESSTQSIQELTYRYLRRAPERIETRWRAYRPIVGVDSLIDLTLNAGQALVRQELRYRLPPGSPARLTLMVPEAVNGLTVVKGGQLLSLPGGLAAIVPSGPQPVVELQYSMALAESLRPEAIPLVHPVGDCRGETRVRIWSESGTLPTTPEGWIEQNLEEVPGRRLPVLVVLSRHLDRPLLLRTRTGGAKALIECALVRVTVTERGHDYSVRYRLGRLAGNHLDFELPLPADSIRLAVTLDGKKVGYELLASENSSMVNRLLRLRLAPQLVRPSAVLELSYHIEPGRVPRTPLTTGFLSPRPQGGISVPTRWQIDAPSEWVILGPEPGAASPLGFARRGWLWGPRPQTSAAELEAWFADTEVRKDAPHHPSLVLWRDAGEPLTLTHIARQWWLVGCSLLVVIFGLALVRMALSPQRGRSAWAWVLSVLLVVVVLALAVFTPALAAQLLYGCEPGLAVLLLLASIQWLVHERYRRQVVFLPNFTRARPESAIVRQEPRPPQPSTVDAPRPVGSSVERGT